MLALRLSLNEKVIIGPWDKPLATFGLNAKGEVSIVPSDNCLVVYPPKGRYGPWRIGPGVVRFVMRLGSSSKRFTFDFDRSVPVDREEVSRSKHEAKVIRQS